MNKHIPIESYAELLALYRLIIEGKFSAHPHDRHITGSAVVARLADRIAKKLHDSPEAHPDSRAAGTAAECPIFTPKSREWMIALKRASLSDLWPTWSLEEKRRYADLLASPFRFSDVLRDHFIAEADANHRSYRRSATLMQNSETGNSGTTLM